MRHLGSHFSEIKERNYSHDGGPDIPLGISPYFHAKCFLLFPPLVADLITESQV